MDFQTALKTLENITGYKPIRRGKSYMALCPCHNDVKGSLGIIRARNGDYPIYNCLAGCSWQDVKRAVEGGTSVSYFKPEKHVESKLIAKYTYVDETSKPLFRKLRFEPKAFAIQSYVNGKWVGGMLHTPVLYRLPEVIRAKTVFLLEGEKAVNALHKWGVTATCTYNGASKSEQSPKWLDEYNDYFVGKHVVLLPDNDEPGQAHMEHVFSVLHDTLSKTIVELPGLANKCDFYDWQQLGYTLSDLRKLWESKKGL